MVCVTDDDCGLLMECMDSLCEHKGLSPLEGMDFLIMLLVLMCTALAAGAGIGGGGLLVPLFMLVGQWDAHEAVPLSKATIFGASIANFIILSKRKHPQDLSRPLIAFDVALMLEPMTLLGTTAGVYANTVFPDWSITLLLVALLSYTTKRVWNKGIALRDREKHEAGRGEGVLHTKAIGGLSYGSLPQHDIPGIAMTTDGNQNTEDLEDDEEEHIVFRSNDPEEPDFAGDAVIQAELSYTRTKTFHVLCSVWALLFTISLLKGGEGADSLVGIECGSFSYWLLAIMLIPICVGVTLKMGKRMNLMHSRLLAAKFRFLEGDVVWTQRNVLLYPMLCTWAGAAAGMLGIGGGMVKGPLMLEMGMIPQVSSATSAFMILFTSSATTIQFLVLGALKLDYAILLACLGFVGGYSGQTMVTAYIKRTNKTAIIIFFLAYVLGLSTALMSLSGLLTWLDTGFAGFEGVCAVE